MVQGEIISERIRCNERALCDEPVYSSYPCSRRRSRVYEEMVVVFDGLESERCIQDDIDGGACGRMEDMYIK